MDSFNNLIGLEEKVCTKILKEKGYNKINIVINSKHNDKCDTNIVCAVRQNNDEITLVCGEFYIDIKGDKNVF